MLPGPETDDDNDGRGRWYFSLNNRRLWVLKRCREEGLLLDTNNMVLVRLRHAKSEAESKRYTIDNCALEAKVMKESPKEPAVAAAASVDDKTAQDSSNASVLLNTE